MFSFLRAQLNVSLQALLAVFDPLVSEVKRLYPGLLLWLTIRITMGE
jgi:hypothetical protein